MFVSSFGEMLAIDTMGLLVGGDIFEPVEAELLLEGETEVPRGFNIPEK